MQSLNDCNDKINWVRNVKTILCNNGFTYKWNNPHNVAQNIIPMTILFKTGILIKKPVQL